MDTFLAFLTVIATVTVIFLALLALPRLRRFIGWIVRSLLGVGLVACRIAARTADFFLSPRAGRIAWWKYAAWLAATLVPLALFIASIAPVVIAELPASLPRPDLAYLLIVGGLFQVLVLAAALVIVHEDYDVMDGIVAPDRRRIGGTHSARRLPTIAIAVAFVFVYAVAVLYWLTEVEGLVLLDKQPATGVTVIDDLLIVLWALPTSFILRAIDWVLGTDTEAAFRVTIVASAFYFTVFAIGTLLLASLASILLHLWWQLRRIVTELGEGREGERAYLTTRARLAPPIIKRGILSAAVSVRDEQKQKRLLEAARDVGIVTFPQTFVHNLESFDEEIRHFGLERALELFRQRVMDFGRGPSETIIRRGARHLRRGKLSVDTTKRLVRLMVAVLTTKKEVVQLDENLKKMIVASVGRELKKARAESDPAFRGLLQDLRAAVARLPSDKPVPLPQPANDWVKNLAPVAADPAAQPDTPARTGTR